MIVFWIAQRRRLSIDGLLLSTNIGMTQDIQSLSQNTWILTPIIFIVVAVLGFNFLGDGLRDALDPRLNE